MERTRFTPQLAAEGTILAPEGSSRSHLSKRPRTEGEDPREVAAGKTRIRISRACDECRKHKYRCDGHRPICANCVRRGHACAYKPSKKRGLRTGYVRALETLLSVIFNTVQGSESWLYSLLVGKESSPTFSLSVSSSAIEGTEPLLDGWRKSLVSKEVEQLLSRTELVDNNEEYDDTHIFDRTALRAMRLADRIFSKNGQKDDCNPLFDVPASPMDTTSPPPLLVVTSPLSNDLSVTAPTLPAAVASLPSEVAEQDEGISIEMSHEVPFSETRDSDLNWAANMPPDWQPLLDVYFDHTHCWLPISPKHDLLKCAYAFANPCKSSNRSSFDPSGDTAFLMAVLTYVSLQKASQDLQDTSLVESYRTQANSLFTTTLQLLSHDGCYEVGHVRALLVLTLAQIIGGHQKAAWITVGRAVYALTSLQGSLLGGVRSFSNLDDGMKRTSLCCIVLDTLVATWVRARPYFQQSDIEEIGFLSIDGIEEWEPRQPASTSKNHTLLQPEPARVLSTFNRLVKHVGIMNDLCRLRNGETVTNEFRELRSRIQREFLPSSYPKLIASNMTPQSLNLELFSVAVLETIRKHEAQLGYVDLESKVTELSAYICQLQDFSQEYTGNLKPHLALPTCKIYHFMLDSVLCSLIKGCHSPNKRMELEDVQRCLYKPPPAQRTIKLSQQTGGEGLLNPARHMQVLDSFTVDDHQERNVQPALGSAYNSPPKTQSSVYARAPGHNVYEQLTMPHNLNLDSITDFTSGNIHEKDLFHSLADLDSHDWSADPSDFMKHLGAVADTSTILDTFFDLD